MDYFVTCCKLVYSAFCMILYEFISCWPINLVSSVHTIHQKPAVS